MPLRCHWNLPTLRSTSFVLSFTTYLIMRLASTCLFKPSFVVLPLSFLLKSDPGGPPKPDRQIPCSTKAPPPPYLCTSSELPAAKLQGVWVWALIITYLVNKWQSIRLFRILPSEILPSSVAHAAPKFSVSKLGQRLHQLAR